MSMRVELDDLPAEILARGPGFLLSSVMDSRPHAVHLRFEVAAAEGQVELRSPAGRTARGNCSQRPAVTVLFPAAEPDQFSLLVDGEARLDGDEHIVVTAVSAVLHRPAPNS